jgi:FkbM family methyltransferase
LAIVDGKVSRGARCPINVIKRLGEKKARFEEIARERLLGSPIFPAVRTAYQSVFNRGKLHSRQQMLSFYSQFVRPGDLVFDVGANVGIYADVFTDLDARVVAIEPNPACLRFLRSLARRTKLKVEACAVSDRSGRIQLQLSDRSLLSTANPEWQSIVEQNPDYSGSRFTEQIEVESVTLDQLAERHGIPNFVKIDVEGFDDRAMFGMSFRPSALSFEFNRLLPAVAHRCLDAPAISSGYEFNFQEGDEMRYLSPTWFERMEFAERLDSLVGSIQWGDVIARRTVSVS